MENYYICADRLPRHLQNKNDGEILYSTQLKENKVIIKQLTY